MAKIYTQEEIKAAVEGKKRHFFVRDAERNAIIVTPENQTEVQAFIESDMVKLGSFDKTSYEKSGYFGEDGVIKVGMAIMINATDDIYINPNFQHKGQRESNGKFSELPFAELIGTYAVTEKREMVKASDVFDEVVTIEAPWGGTQELRQDGWINIGWNEIYVINADPDGLPAGGFEPA